MALVVLLRGVNVGGYRNFRPSLLAYALKPRDVVNIGAAGTFVVRKPIGRLELRQEISRRLPFEADVMICEGRDVLRLVAADPFAGLRASRRIVPFVSLLARRRPAPRVPLRLPARGDWCVRVLGHDHPFVFGLYRREMKAIGYLGQLERLFGVPVTTRSWSTFLAIARILEMGAA